MTPADDTSLRANPGLVEGWMRARSLARGLPEPVSDHGGWRLETALPNERRRYIFAAPSQALSALARTIAEPRVFLKLCGSQAEMSALLPAGWALQPTISMMTCEGPTPQPAPPAGYTIEVSTSGAVTNARILSSDGGVAANGYAAESDGVFVYDRIVVDPSHRRRGLGGTLMSALGAARQSAAAVQVLVATPEGQALYASLGWRVHAPYTTAVIPDAD